MTAAKKRRIKNAVSCYLMGVWPLIGFLLFSAAPLFISLYLGFTKLNSRNFTYAHWIGFKNYIDLFHDHMFFKAVLNTLYSLLSVPINLAVGLLVGMAMSAEKVKGKKVIRVIFFIPYLCSASVVASVFMQIFDAEFGAVNTILRNLGLKQHMFFRSEKAFMPLMFVLLAWTNMGYYALLFFGALNGVPKDALEAAKIDGCNSVQSFFRITLPLITPTTFFLLTTGLISGLQAFAQFQIIGQSLARVFTTPYGPNNAGVTVVYYLYTASFKNNFTQGVGYGSAMAWVLAVVVVILTVLNFRLSKKWVHYD